jgi:hypothetical protein
MAKQLLSNYFTLRRRYTRSINIERDKNLVTALEGYILTDKSLDALQRLFSSFKGDQPNYAWTLTGVYGTGKSAFAQFLTALCSPASSPPRKKALAMLGATLDANSQEYMSVQTAIPSKGFVCAVATADREPLIITIVRALKRGVEDFWKSADSEIFAELTDLEIEFEHGKLPSSRTIIKLARQIAKTSKTGLLIVVDELGKNLEFVTQHSGTDDLFLLQQLAELHYEGDVPIYIMGLLHQAFSDYGHRLSITQRNEWSKIQGRFEDIPFTESTAQTLYLMGEAIERSETNAFSYVVYKNAEAFLEYLQRLLGAGQLTAKTLASIYPLHPLTALVLPALCTRYAQNDRSLFTFLTSQEPYSFNSFLQQNYWEGEYLPTMKLYHVYDYFIESVGMTSASRANAQRWIEVQTLVNEARHLPEEQVQFIKTIGVLNLAPSVGGLRATPELVMLALCDEVPQSNDITNWNSVLSTLQNKGLIIHRKQLNELRLWEGSDFDIDTEVSIQMDSDRSTLAALLSNFHPLKPLIAQRHSYHAGTMRYFERCYLDSDQDFKKLTCLNSESDGLIGYWLSDVLPQKIPPFTQDGKPFILLAASNILALTSFSQEYAALLKIRERSPQLQQDGVARKEVQFRITSTRRLLDEALRDAFKVDMKLPCFALGERKSLLGAQSFNSLLSQLCDQVYSEEFILWNELINRRELTSQGAKARRVLIEAMIEQGAEERLALEGNGPEVSMYYSVLERTGIHRYENGAWGFYPPNASRVESVWRGIEGFCLNAKEKPVTIDHLYTHLSAPPYGIKQGVIPVFLAAVLLYHADDVSFYKDGTFVPVLGAEHFELLMKDPSRFSVKYFEVAGLRIQVFKDLEAILRRPNAPTPDGVRNATLLSVAKPLFQFVKKLPNYTLRTKSLSSEAQAVLTALSQAQEPDTLLFSTLPLACGLPPFTTDLEGDGNLAQVFKKKLVQALREIQTAYELLLNKCRKYVYHTFGLRLGEEKLRLDLQGRANYIASQTFEPTLRRFVLAAGDDKADDRKWLEALLMVVADKPAEAWTDQDETLFEMKLNDLARRFINLEALQKEVAAYRGDGFEARLITITRSDGQDIRRMVWLEEEQRSILEEQLEKFMQENSLLNSPHAGYAFAAMLTERILSTDPTQEDSKLESNGNTDRSNAKRRARPESKK